MIGSRAHRDFFFPPYPYPYCYAQYYFTLLLPSLRDSQTCYGNTLTSTLDFFFFFYYYYFFFFYVASPCTPGDSPLQLFLVNSSPPSMDDPHPPTPCLLLSPFHKISPFIHPVSFPFYHSPPSTTVRGTRERGEIERGREMNDDSFPGTAPARRFPLAGQCTGFN